jgi:hypothetical protein
VTLSPHQISFESRAVVWVHDRTLQFREEPNAPVVNPSALRRAQLLPLTGRTGRAETASGPASDHTNDLLSPLFLRLQRSEKIDVSLLQKRRIPPRKLSRRERETQTPLYRSNFTAFANVLTPPSVHHHMHVC